MGEKFKLKFFSDSIGTVSIDEPFGFNTLSFDFMQKAKGMGRDISFNSGEMQLEFTHTRNHYLPELLYYFNYYGFEAKVQLIISFNGIDEVIGDLDFAKAATDGLEYFRCKVIQKSELQIIKRRSKVKVDMFSDKDLDGNAIDKAPITNVLVKAKAVYQESKWEFKNKTTNTWRSGAGITLYSSITQSIILSEIFDTLTPFSLKSYDKNDLKILTASQNLKNITINITDFKSKIYALDQDAIIDIYLFYGKEASFSKNAVNLLSTNISNNANVDFSKDLIQYKIDKLDRGESIWLMVVSSSRPFNNNYIFGAIEISNANVLISAESIAYNSITKAVRLNDVQKQIVKSCAGIEVLAPRYEQNGQFYDTFLLNGNLLRLITDKPFTVSLDDIENSLTEHNADYEVNDKVFFGIEQDFYTNRECGFFDNTQFSAFSKKFNEKYSINTFNFKYKNYQALKENEQPNTGDTIHGETELLLSNKMVENTKSVEVEWTRDSFLIDEARKKAIEITKGTAYQNDSDLFALDCVKNEVDLKYTETSQLNHEWNGVNLILRSNETLNFSVIGIFENAPFEIKAPDNNTGLYTVAKVSNQELQLTWISGGAMGVGNNGIRFTEYTYTIPKEQIPYVSKTIEGVDNTLNIKSPETFANMLYSVKRNVIQYYNSYLATCNLYHKEKAISTTLYKNNGDAFIDANGLTTTEKQDLTPSNPILSPYMYEGMVYSNVDLIDFINLQKELRSKRGFIRSIDKNENPIKVYPTKMTYKNLEKELTIIGEEKYEPTLMTIETSATFTTINNETKVYHLEWEIIDNQLVLYDMGRFRLYSPVDWFRVSVNGVTAPTINILESWLKLIK